MYSLVSNNRIFCGVNIRITIAMPSNAEIWRPVDFLSESAKGIVGACM